jgi:aconitate hydratase
VVLVKSFARIHEANLKKQGILPLTFADKADYEKIEQNDKLTIKDLENLRPGSKVTVSIHKEDGSTLDIETDHSLSDEQISWFESGSALNYIKSN